MKKTFLSLALVIGSLMAGTTAFAQAPAQEGQAKTQKAPARQGRQVYNPFEGLNLSEQQMADLKALADAKQEKMKKSREEAQKERKDVNPEERAAAALAERKEDLAKIKAILTPEQYVQYLENAYLNLANNNAGRRDMRQGAPRMGGDRQGGPRQGGQRRGGGNGNM